MLKLLTATPKTRAGLNKAIRYAGGQTELAELLGTSRQTVHQWVSNGMIPHNRLDDVVKVFQNRIKKSELRPDIYKDDMPAIERVVFIAGGITALSDKLGIKVSTARAWAYGESPVPPRYVNRLCDLSDGRVKPQDLRPDLFKGTKRGR